jgi:hypothetical protein
VLFISELSTKSIDFLLVQWNVYNIYNNTFYNQRRRRLCLENQVFKLKNDFVKRFVVLCVILIRADFHQV